MKEETKYEFIECLNAEREDALEEILSCQRYLLTCIEANLRLMEQEYEKEESNS